MKDTQPASSLGVMVDAVLQAPSPAVAAEALVALQHELLAADDSSLSNLSAATVPPIARRAAEARHVVIERHGSGATAAVVLGEFGPPLVAVHEFLSISPLTLALAEERLTLTAALMKGLGNEERHIADVALVLAQEDRDRGLTAAAVAIQRSMGGARIIAARVSSGSVTAVSDTQNAVISSEQLARLKLAVGEAFDLGRIDAVIPLPPGLAALAQGEALVAQVSTAGPRAAVIIAIGAVTPRRLCDWATIIAAVRPVRKPLIPEEFVARVERRLPWPANWSGQRRARAVRAGLAALPALLLLVPVPTTVEAPALIEALNQRVVTAPFDGRIESVLAQPGDVVRAGTSVLVRLDPRAAESEHAEVVAEMQSALAQAEAAQVDGRSDDERIARLRAAQFSARAEILALQVAAATIAAPIDGVVAGDDLRKRTGGPVSRGETLLSVATPGSYRVEARVSDRDIGTVEIGQVLTIALKSRPLERPHAVVTRIYPIAEVEEGDNIFRVIATLDKGAGALLPGMAGRVSIRTGWAPIGWLLLRPPVSWIRQKLWI